MNCPICAKPLTECPKSYSCTCETCDFIIWKVMSGRKITPDIVVQLLSTGRTERLDGFTSRAGKPFAAVLAIKDGKVVFEFPANKTPRQQQQENPHEDDAVANNTGSDKKANIRVQSANSGSVHIIIKGAAYKEADISFGHVSSRMAECLGLITAAKYVKHKATHPAAVTLDISLNNLDFSRYLLRERIPRDKEIKAAVEYLWETLKDFAGWQAAYKPEKRPKLQGSPQSSQFPKGIFPWLDAETAAENGGITVKLPNSPEVRAQFAASLRNAAPQAEAEGIYTLPVTAQAALNAWLNSVK